MARKPKLAIVSTFDDLCGIAGYTRGLVTQLQDDFEIEVFDLDQFFMRSKSPGIRRLADDKILEFCSRMSGFDCVNVQLEYGTLGSTRKDIVRRFGWIANAAPQLSVTFHTILAEEKLTWEDRFNLFFRLKFYDLAQRSRRRKDYEKTIAGFYGLLRSLSKKKPTSVIVHTERDFKVMKYANRLPEVLHHPLVFLTDERIETLKATAERSLYPGLSDLPENVKLIGVFGFLSTYKGFDTVIRALPLLPENYHLAIFGGLHPNEIRPHGGLNPYIKNLLDLTLPKTTAAGGNGDSKQLIMADSDDQPSAVRSRTMVEPAFSKRQPRVHFLGTQTDDRLAQGMAICDAVVMPYHEVGQTSSGPISLAVEMGARIVAARNNAFLEFAKYHPDRIEFFEIDNHLELAQRILSRPPHSGHNSERAYNARTNREIYLKANAAR